MISAFAIYVHPQLQLDPTDESVALLRVILFKMDNTVFGGDVPQLPKWTGPPRTIIATQFLLYISLLCTIAGVFFAIISKQLLDLFVFARSRGEHLRPGLRWFTVSLRIILSALFFILLFALLTFASALCIYLYQIDVWIFSLLVIAVGVGLPIYFWFGLAALISIDFPHLLLQLREELELVNYPVR